MSPPRLRTHRSLQQTARNRTIKVFILDAQLESNSTLDRNQRIFAAGNENREMNDEKN